MSDFVLPIITTDDSQFPIYDFDLEGSRYRFRFKYSQFEDRYYFSLYDGDDDLIVAGIKIVLNVSLLRKETDIRVPPGYLMAIDTEGSNTDAGLGELGSRVQLLYTESS